MIKHIVMFNLKTFETEIEKQKAILEIKSNLEKLPSLISEIKHFEIGINKVESERAADIVLISEFNSIDDLKTYTVHPEHVKVAEIILKLRERSTVVDFEF
jgi:hypothetical protein